MKTGLFLRWKGLGLMVSGCCLFPAVMPAGDFTFYSVGKGVYYDQTAGGAPVLKVPVPWLFYAQVIPESNWVFNANVRATTWPTTQRVYLSDSFSTPLVGVRRDFDQIALDSAYPNSNYEFTVFTKHDGQQIVTVEMTASEFPPPPTITNLPSAQSVDSTSDFVLKWDPLPEGTTNDFAYCQLQGFVPGGIVFRTGYVPGAPDALNGTDAAVTILAGTLSPGRAYLGRLIFARAQTVVTNAYPGARGTSFFFSQTDFWVKTQGGGDTTPPLVVGSSPANGATGVPAKTPVAFSFSEPMYTGSFSTHVTGSVSVIPQIWSPDGTMLALGAGQNFGQNELQLVILNPYDQHLAMRDLSGNPLPADTVLVFTSGSNRLNPPPALLFDGQWATNGDFQTDLLGEPFYAYTLEYSSNLTSWVSLRTNIAFGGRTRFVDTNAVTAGRRFYRAVAR